MRNTVVLAFIAVVFIAALKWRYAALLVYWWFGIFRPQEWLYMDVSNLRLPLIAAILFTVPCLMQRIVPRVNNLLAILMCTFVVLSFVAFLSKGCTDVAQHDAMYSLAILVYIVLLSVQLVHTRSRLFWFVAVVAISLAFHSGKGGLYSLLSGKLSQYDSQNLQGMFSGSNAYALISAMLLFFMLFAARYLRHETLFGNFPRVMRGEVFRRSIRYIMLLLAFGTAYNVISLSSRGASVAMFIGFLTWIFLQKSRLKILSFVVPLVAIGLTVVPLPEDYVDRISSVFVESEERDNSAASRPHFWQTAVYMAKKNPLGVGPGCYAAYYDQFDPSYGRYGSRRSVHSSHFQVLADSGYMGLVIWALLFFVSYSKLMTIRRNALREISDGGDAKFILDLTVTLICAQTVFVVGGAFYEMAYADIIWLIWGLTIALDSLQRTETKNRECGGATIRHNPRIRTRIV